MVISGRTAASLEEGLARIRVAGAAEAVQLDVSDREAVARVAEDIEQRHGRIDILVNSAGVNLAKRYLRNMTAQDWDRIVGVNLSGLFYCCFAVIRGMRARKDGLIVNVSSWAGRHTSALVGPAYSASKRAVLAVTETINLEECTNGIRATSIRATSILPGGFEAPGN